MIPTYVEPYRDGELRIGWASWDTGCFQCRSIKWAYRNASGKISRGSPEIPFDILVDMVLMAHRQGELSAQEVDALKATFCQMRVPNAETIAAMQELEEGRGQHFDSVEALMADLNAED